MIGWADVLEASELLGQGLPFSGCARRGRNLCKKDMDPAVVVRLNEWHARLEKNADALGKDKCNRHVFVT